MGRFTKTYVDSTDKAEKIAYKQAIEFLKSHYNLIDAKNIDAWDLIIYFLTEILPTENTIWKKYIEKDSFYVDEYIVNTIYASYSGKSNLLFPKIALGMINGTNMYSIKDGRIRLSIHGSQKMKNIIDTEGKTSVSVLNKLKLIKDNNDRLKETYINEVYSCIEYNLQISAIITMWTFTVYYLRDYVFNNKEVLERFNSELKNNHKKGQKKQGDNNVEDPEIALETSNTQSNNDRKPKIKEINKIEDFEYLTDIYFIQHLYKSRTINKQQNHLLESSLNKRNAVAHPTSYQTGEYSAVSYVEEILNNIIQHFTMSNSLEITQSEEK